MKKNIYKSVILLIAVLCFSIELRGQAAVTVVGSSTDFLIEKLAAIATSNATANTTVSSLITDEAIRKRLSDVVTTMNSVQSFVEMANSVSCLMGEFESSMEWAREAGYVNCAMGEDMNVLMNKALMVMDGANMALSAVLETDPSNRIFLIQEAVNNFVDVQHRLAVYTVYFNRLRQIQATARVEKREMVSTAGLSRF